MARDSRCGGGRPQEAVGAAGEAPSLSKAQWRGWNGQCGARVGACACLVLSAFVTSLQELAPGLLPHDHRRLPPFVSNSVSRGLQPILLPQTHPQCLVACFPFLKQSCQSSLCRLSLIPGPANPVHSVLPPLSLHSPPMPHATPPGLSLTTPTCPVVAPLPTRLARAWATRRRPPSSSRLMTP